MAADVKARFTQRLRAAVDQFPVTNGPRRHAQEARSNLIETVSLQIPARRFLQPSPGCESPRLWLLVSGHFRTFHWTQMDMAEMARRSSHGCYLAVAVMPQEFCALNGSHASASCLPPGRGAAVDTRDPLLEWRDFAPSSHSVPSLLETASRRAFHGRLGFAVIRRGRDVSGYVATCSTSRIKRLAKKDHTGLLYTARDAGCFPCLPCPIQHPCPDKPMCARRAHYVIRDARTQRGRDRAPGTRPPPRPALLTSLSIRLLSLAVTVATLPSV